MLESPKNKAVKPAYIKPPSSESGSVSVDFRNFTITKRGGELAIRQNSPFVSMGGFIILGCVYFAFISDFKEFFKLLKLEDLPVLKISLILI